MHKRSPGFVPAHVHNRRYAADEIRQATLALDTSNLSNELKKRFQEAAKQQIDRLASALPLPNYHGHPVATAHDLRKLG